MQGKTKKQLKQYLVRALFLLVLIWVLVPLVWSFASSFKTREDFGSVPPPFFPAEPTLRGYERVFSDYRFWRLMGNSLGIATVSTLITVGLSSMAAYGFSRYALKWRNLLLIFVLIPRLVPRISLIVPISQIVRAVPGLYNTQMALVIVYAGAAIPFATWIMIGFIGSIPKELDESAKIDGANTFQIFVRMILPLSIPGLLTIAVMSFRDAWNEFPFALALTSTWTTRTLPYQLFLYRDTLRGMEDFATLHAFTWLSIIPILLIYIKFEKYVVAGMTAGAVK